MRLFLKRLVYVCLISVLVISCETATGVTDDPDVTETRIKENFGENWQFQRLSNSAPPPGNWENVNIPHTVKIEPLVVNDQWQGTSVYKKNFEVVNLPGKKWFFHFEGVMQEARVSINGEQVHINKGGYLPFTVDATPYLKEGEVNSIEVEVINEDDTTIPPGKKLEDLDFNLYGGIYRNVYLIKTNEIYITDAVHADKVNGGGILFHTSTANTQNASGFVKTHIKNESGANRNLRLRLTFTDVEENTASTVTGNPFQLNSGEDISLSLDFDISNPFLWSISDPNLYRLRVDVMADGEAIDSQELKVGLRKIALTGEAFYLNDEPLFINGTNRHQEYPYVGYALSDEAQYRDAYKIKEAGFDFVRLSHYPQATAFLEACDELGLLVMNAIPGWQYFEEGEFVENAIQDIKDMARRDRNHPSVIFWENSLNESEMTEEFMIRANKVLKAELPYEDTFTAGWWDHPSYDLFIPARQHSKPPHYWNFYNKINRPVFIAEYGDWEYYAQNAGFNQTAFSDLQEEERTSRQLRGDGEARLLQQALNYQEAFNSNLKGRQTIGHANWLMFDYNRGYADDLEASGISDIFRLPKFSYYFYKSQRAAYTDEFSSPFVFIANYWTPQSTTDVKVFGNVDEVALYLNDELVERKGPDINEISEELLSPPFIFEIGTFSPGTLRAVGFINGREVANHHIRTPGEPGKIELDIDFSGKNVAVASPDMVFVYARILDENGTTVPLAKNRVTFSIEGQNTNAEIIGGTSVNAEAGIATILLRTNSYTQPFRIKAVSEGLQDGTITIKNP